MPGCGVPASDDGFTLIELLVVMTIATVLMSIGAFGFWNWRSTAQHQGSAQQLVSQLRNTSEQAISEGRTYCLDLAAGGRSYSLWRYACSAAGSAAGGPYPTQSTKVTITAVLTQPPTVPPCPGGDQCMYFYPRGTAIPTTITVSSTARSRTYTIHVEGLTARVWM
jgi:type II secretion system protein H